MKTVIASLILLSTLTSCVKASEFSTLHVESINVKQGTPVEQDHININDTLYDSPDAYALVNGGKLDSTVISKN